VYGGNQDVIGLGPASATVGGNDLYLHSAANATLGFGTFVDTTKGGSSSATVTVGTVSGGSVTGGFNTSTDFIFYPGESATTTQSIVATSTQVTVGGAASTLFILPDGTAMTLVGVPQADFNTAFFKP
jgi:hypothetical protein